MTAIRHTSIEALLRHDRYIVVAGLALVTSLAWVYTLAGVGMSAGTADMTLLGPVIGGEAMRHMPWSPTHAMLMFAMWWVMMIAMMTPSAAPMVLLFVAIKRKQQQEGRMPTGIFLAGYLVMWALFSAVATLTQWSLEASGLLTPLMASASRAVSGSILVAVGFYQLSALKAACLTHCQHPVRFLTQHWHPGVSGAFSMGLIHGAYCLGCCWFLMALLFFGGVMNVYWIVGISIYVALEKLLLHGLWLGRAIGIALVASGVLVFMQVL